DGHEPDVHRTRDPEAAADIDNGAVQMIDFSGSPFQQILPHRRGVARRREDAVDRFDEIEIEGNTVGTSDFDALVDHELLQGTQSGIRDAADVAADDGRHGVDHAVDHQLPPDVHLDRVRDTTVESASREEICDFRTPRALLDQRVAGELQFDDTGRAEDPAEVRDRAQDHT